MSDFDSDPDSEVYRALDWVSLAVWIGIIAGIAGFWIAVGVALLT